MLGIILLVFVVKDANSQDNSFKNSSINTGVGVGINSGKAETGIGLVYSIGWQKAIGKRKRLRLNPNITFGNFRTYAIPTDTRNQMYKITSFGINMHYDLIKFKSFSIIISGGGFINYSRGLLGSGGMPGSNGVSSGYFYSLYYGGNASVGFRIDPPKSKLAYVIKPINIHLGSDIYLLAYQMFGVDIKFKAN